MLNFQDTFETRKRSFIIPFSICMTVPLRYKSYLYFIFSTTLIVSSMPSLTKRFEIMVTATLRKNLGPSMLKRNNDSCLQEDQES